MHTVLCEACLSLFDRSEPSGRDLEHHESLSKLKAAARHGCTICTMLCERVVIAEETRSDASTRSGYSKLSQDVPDFSQIFRLSFSVFPPPLEAIERYGRYGMRFDKLAEFWVIEDGRAVRPAHTFPSNLLTYF